MVLVWSLPYAIVCIFVLCFDLSRLVDDVLPLANLFVVANWCWLALVALELFVAWRGRVESLRSRLYWPAAALVLLVFVQVMAYKQRAVGQCLVEGESSFRDFIAYVEPWGEVDEAPRIRRASVNRLGTRLRVDGREWQQKGPLLNIDPRTGTRYVVARARRGGDDALYKQQRVLIDEAVRVEYWTQLRKRAASVNATNYDPKWSPNGSRGR